jgi:hypothetical protein
MVMATCDPRDVIAVVEELESLDPDTMTIIIAGEEMLRISPQGFWVRGVPVPQDGQEAQAVYNSFREFLTWATMTRP